VQAIAIAAMQHDPNESASQTVFSKQPLMTVNSILQAFCFDYHPSQVGKRALKLELLTYHDIHDNLLKVILNRLEAKIE